MIRIRVTSSYRVDCQATIEVPIALGALWEILNPWTKSATWDPFHRRIVELDGPACVGGRIVIEHAYGPIRLARTGRLLRHRPGQGFAFSDLSVSRPTRRFPHSYSYELTELSPAVTRVRVRIRGRWTARVGRAAVRIWLWWVMKQLEQRLQNHIMSAWTATAPKP